MILIKKVRSIEVKRCFVLSQRFTSKQMKKKGIKGYKPSEETIKRNLSKTQKKVCQLSERSLNRIIRTEYKKRAKLYDDLEWYLGEITPSEAKVWKGAGGLYEAWTLRLSLKDTAKKVKSGLNLGHSSIQRRRAMRVIPKIIVLKDLIQKERYLLPIVIPNGSYKKHAGGIRSIPWFIDDGCMRSLAYAVSGDKRIKVYIGIPHAVSQSK